MTIKVKGVPMHCRESLALILLKKKQAEIVSFDDIPLEPLAAAEEEYLREKIFYFESPAGDRMAEQDGLIVVIPADLPKTPRAELPYLSAHGMKIKGLEYCFEPASGPKFVENYKSRHQFLEEQEAKKSQ